MISSSCKKLSLLEIIYSTVKRLIKVIDKNTDLPENFKLYLEESHYNDTIYRSRDKDLNSKFKAVLKDALKLHSLYRDNEIKDTEEFKLLCWMLKEQKGQGSKNLLKRYPLTLYKTLLILMLIIAKRGIRNTLVILLI